MKAIVTGAAGFIGSRLCEILLENNWDVLGVDAFTNYYSEAIKRTNIEISREYEAFSLVEGNTRKVLTTDMLQDADVVFHQAGQPGVRASWDLGFQDYVDNNILATQDLLEKLVRARRPRLVMASSSSVYGSAQTYPVVETDPTRPFSPYGVTKLTAERLAIAYADNFGLDVVALRYFTVYGPRQRPDMAIGRLITSALTGGLFPLFGGAQKIRDFTFVDDVVRANRAAATAALTEPLVANVCGGTSVTIDKIISTVEAATGRSVAIDQREPENGDVDRTGGDRGLALTRLGWEPAVSLEEGIVRHVEWARSVL